MEVLSAEVLRQMEEQMAQDESKAYFTEEFTAIDPSRITTEYRRGSGAGVR